MNRHAYLIPLILAAVSLASCSDDDGGDEPVSANVNRNIAAPGTPAEVSRLEFPRVRGGQSMILVYRTADPQGVNYSVEWDAEKKTNRWSCYTMTADYAGNAGRYQPDKGERQYPWDPDLAVEYRFPSDLFSGSGYDHGHICPSADRQYSKEANRQTFYMTNMQPQKNRFNAGLWAKMEDKVRKWTPKSAGDTLFVCKGGTIDNEAQIIGRIKDQLIIPRYFYMALLLKKGGTYSAIALWAEALDENHSNDSLRDYVLTVDQLEARTGIDFFCNLPDKEENAVEGQVAYNYWGL